MRKSKSPICCRDLMKKVLPMLAIAAMAVSVSSAHAQSTFRDVPNNHWAAEAVKRLAEAGIIEGRPANEVQPAKITTMPPKRTTKVASKRTAKATRIGGLQKTRSASR